MKDASDKQQNKGWAIGFYVFFIELEIRVFTTNNIL